MKALGTDLGFYQIKLANESGNRKFLSVIGYPSSVELKDHEEEASEHNLFVTDNGRTYYVGEKALRDTKNAQLTFVADKTDKASDRIKYLASLGMAMGEETQGTISIVTGLPVDEFAGIKGLRERLEYNMKGTFQFTFGKKRMRVNVPKVHVIPQSAGAYYDYILDDDGNIISKHVNPKTVVIDIGYRTTDVVTLVNAKYSPSESFTVLTGVSDVHKEMRKRLIRDHRLTKELSEVDEIVRRKTISLGGVEVSVAPSIQEATQPYAEKILSTIPIYITNTHEIHRILVTGGGAHLMFPVFHQEFQRAVPIDHMKESEFSNARGYYKYAQFLAQNGRD